MHHFRIPYLLSSLLLLVSVTWAGREFPARPGEVTVPDELLVKLVPTATLADIQALLPPAVQAIAIHRENRRLRLKLPPGLAAVVSSRLGGGSHVQFFEPTR